MTPRLRAIALPACLLVLMASGAACGREDAADTAGAGAGPAATQSGLEGTIESDGSSTVGPLTTYAAEQFQAANPDVRVTVGISGTGGGFERFCEGETALSNASRPIKDEEVPICEQNGIEFTEFHVANDGITVVVNKDNDWADCLTTEQLKAMWEPGSTVDSWNDVDPSFPDEPMTLAGPGTDSGTFDFFTDEINGEEGASRTDYSATEDDNVIVQAVSGDPGGLGYFGFSYYEENQDTLKALAVDGGEGCVAPSVETIQDGTYAPLARPLFVYANNAELARPEVAAFVDYMVSNQAQIAPAVQYVALTDDQATTAEQALQTALDAAGAARRGASSSGGGRPGGAPPPGPAAGRPPPRPRRGEQAIALALAACAMVSVVTTVGIVVALLVPALEFFDEVGPIAYLTGTTWSPLFADGEFGVVPLVVGTLSVTFWASVVAIPFGLGAAIYLSEYAHRRTRAVVKPVLEVLAGIPTVVFGWFALTFFTPFLRELGLDLEIFNALSAGIVMGIMLIPTVASLSEDAMAAVPQDLRAGAFALGSNRLQVSTRVVVPAAISGIAASFVLGISRAIGETMIVVIAAGQQPSTSLDPRGAIEAMTAFIAATGTGDVPTGSIEYKTIFAVGLTLFAMTLVMNVISIRLVRRYREIYE